MARSFGEISEFDPNTIMVVDALNLAFRWKHAKSYEFVEDYIKVIQSLRRSYKAQYVIITCDEGSSRYRKEIYPEYKQNRKDKQAQQTPEEELEFKLFIEEFNRTIEEIAKIFPVLKFPKVEADDIASYLVQELPKYFEVNKIWLISSDKDWDLLINERTSRFSYVTRKETTFDNWHEHYDYPLEDHISIKCLMGDSGDNIKGISGIGPKRAQELIREYGSALDIYASLPIPSKYKYIQNLNAEGEVIPLNYQLMDLLTYSHEAIGESNIATINAKILGALQEIKK